MKGDFSRFTFDRKNRYSRVLMQQGRVQLDADWNEQLDISAYRTETEITDFIGQSGAPENPKDSNEQSTSFRITVNQNEILIGEGRYYVEGMLFENNTKPNESVSFTAQPDYQTALPEKPDTVTGIYLAYLDVWQHHVTALEVPALREVALGGADTTTRVKNVWQVKLHRLGNKGSVSESVSDYASPKWKPSWEYPISTGKLTVDTTQTEAIVENQLYRIEIHQGNAAKANQTVTFKWSQDNGAIAAQVESIDKDNNITIRNAGRDTQLAFPIGQLIECSHETLTLLGQPGILATVQGVQGDRLTVKCKTADDEKALEGLKDRKDLIIRRWDSSGAIEIGDQAHQLKQGITVKFGSGKYKTGDYWLITSRALTGSIEWSPDPHDVTWHHYCSLALLERTNTQFSVLADCRSIFKPITSGLVSKAGDRMTGSLTIDKDLYVMGNVGVGTSEPDTYAPARLTVKSKNNNGGSKTVHTATPESVLALVRDGVQGWSWQNIVDFRLGRYDDGFHDYDAQDPGKKAGNRTLRPRTQLDIVLTNGNLNIESERYTNVMTLRSNGNVGIGTTSPKATLDVNGSLQTKLFGTWKVGSKPNGVLVITIGEDSYYNVIPLNPSGSGVQRIELVVPTGSNRANWIATYLFTQNNISGLIKEPGVATNEITSGSITLQPRGPVLIVVYYLSPADIGAGFIG